MACTIGVLSIFALVLGKSEKKNATSTTPPKKATYLKPTKGPKSLVDRFRALPVDDLAFIKELDKQFATYGGNVKIKVAKVNSTATVGKNVKRTINGEVGYGYQMDQSSNDGYYFSKPKFQVYPYSQHDIPPANNHFQPSYKSAGPHQHYRPQPDRYQQAPAQHASQMSTYQNNHYLPEPQVMRHTAVELIPSQSFELKKAQNGHYQLFSPGQHQEEQQQITAGYYEQPQQQQQQQQHHQSMNYHQQEETVPVIVLRIPGPQKYAAHLQALLQQYLEIRAAEYIKTLQEQEQQQQQQQQHQQQHYHQQEDVASMGQQQQYYSQHVNIEQSATEHPQNHHVNIDYHHQQAAQEDVAEHQSANDEPQQHLSYDLVPPKDESQGQHDDQVQYQYVTIDQSETQPQSEHQHNQPQEQPHYVYGPPAHSKYQDDSSNLPVHENYPSSQHTHVYFPSAHRGHTTHQNTDDESAINQPQPFHAPVMYVQEPRHQYQQHDDEQTETDHAEEQHNAQYYQQHSEEPVEQSEYNSASEHNVVTITQRAPVQSAYPQQPYNYHAHQAAAHRPVIEPTAYVSGPAPHSMSKGAKRQAAALSNQQQYRQKINKLISGLKLKASSKEADDSYEAGSEFKITVVRRH